MNILILTQYYPPETGAPQNRLHETAKLLKKKGCNITILTAMPNYPKGEIFTGYKGKLFSSETIDDITVKRAWIYPSKSKSIILRLLNYFSFTISSFLRGCLGLGKIDVIITESPPLFLGLTGWLLSKIKRAKFIFNISDLWPESVVKLGLMSPKSIFIRLAYILESFLYKRAHLVTCQTQGIVNYVSKQVPNVHLFTNGIDPEAFPPRKPEPEILEKYSLNGHFVCAYGGVLGLAQGLDTIIDAASEAQQNVSLKNVRFLMIGDGPERNRLETICKEKKLTNLTFTGNIPKTDMPKILSCVDAALVPLKKLDIFLGAIPSKIFENMSMEIPIILGVDGEARHIIEKADGGIYIEPENATELTNAIQKLVTTKGEKERLGQNGRNYVLKHYSREQLVETLFQKLKILTN